MQNLALTSAFCHHPFHKFAFYAPHGLVGLSEGMSSLEPPFWFKWCLHSSQRSWSNRATSSARRNCWSATLMILKHGVVARDRMYTGVPTGLGTKKISTINSGACAGHSYGSTLAHMGPIWPPRISHYGPHMGRRQHLSLPFSGHGQKWSAMAGHGRPLPGMVGNTRTIRKQVLRNHCITFRSVPSKVCILSYLAAQRAAPKTSQIRHWAKVAPNCSAQPPYTTLTQPCTNPPPPRNPKSKISCWARVPVNYEAIWPGLAADGPSGPKRQLNADVTCPGVNEVLVESFC